MNLNFNGNLKVLFGHYFNFIVTRISWRENLISTDKSVTFRAILKMALRDLGVPTLLILPVTHSFSFLTTGTSYPGTAIPGGGWDSLIPEMSGWINKR